MSSVSKSSSINNLMTPRFKFRDVTVTYSNRTILKDINFTIAGAELCSIIGANGSGKTTLLRLACGISLPTKGDIYVNGYSTERHWNKIRRNMGVSLYSERAFHFRLTGRQNLIYFGRLEGMRKSETLSKLTNISNNFTIAPLLDRRFSELSLGQRKIFGMVVAFILSDDIVILDEPTSTLDNQNSIAAGEMIRWAIDQRKTVLITTHDPNLLEISEQVIKI
ncbi:ATP-binding cassette domain-containing protein [Corynebacterium kozikiae]|uniref:ATP-binding cassette domain-containing protein n=1 Tax=Corynebacterium kozikiae TaxID=2968469 RepID=UPI00211B8087|nr:ABC transporter ATP-binding protein [Corynebacterium sp. 76QC2CO]MCQ9344100.1 ABC transporter ATP-binding protein [Corynebacterium sp. 76QC2CO]